MKLYIPTTSLNFNNILSTESISPKSFYQKRGFGYSRWFTIPENNKENIILLYSTPCAFSRPQSDLEDHPMLVEIESEEEFPILKEGVYYSDHTIYLAPTLSRFIFFSEQDMKVVHSMSDSSAETKMVRLYSRANIVKIFSTAFPIVEEGNDIPLNEQAIDKDRIINTIKGLLYGYYIGGSLSVDSSYVKRLNSLREIQNIFSSVISSVDKIPSISQNERLQRLFDSFVEDSPICNSLSKELGSNDLALKAIKVLQEYNITLPIYDWRRLVAELRIESKEPNKALVWVQSELLKLTESLASKRTLLSLEDIEIGYSQESQELVSLKEGIIPNEAERKLFFHWVNNFLTHREYQGKISAFKEELSDEFTKSAKESMSDDVWQDSPIRIFLNHLRRHMRGEEFTLPWNNGLLSSLAAVLIKGDDWEPMLVFMQSKGMTDYRLGFALYGALYGFANLLRDFTDKLLKELNPNYVRSLYCEIHGELHGIAIDPQRQYEEVSKVESVASTLSPKAIDHKDEFNNKVWDFFNSNEFSNRTQNKRTLEEGLKICLDNPSVVDFKSLVIELGKLTKYKWGTKNKPWQKFKEHFCPEYVPPQSVKKIAKTKGATGETPSLFDKISVQESRPKTLVRGVVKELASEKRPLDNLQRYVYKDDAAWSYIVPLIPVDSLERLKEDFFWFMGEMRKPCNQRMNYYQNIDETDNEKVINSFCSLKKGLSKKTGLPQALYFTQELRLKIKEKLLSIYCAKR